MRKEIHIVTVGTSIVANFCKTAPTGEEIEKYKVKEWPIISPTHPLQETIKKFAEEKKSNSIFNQILEFVRANPTTASAELNALIAFEKIYGKNPKKIVLLTTDTGTGILCGNLLQEYLLESDYEVPPPRVIKGFGAGPTLFDTALASIMYEILNIAKTHEHKIFLNATGGFKPETCFAVIAALLTQKVDVIYYIHESFRTLVSLPTPPIELSPSLKEKLSKLDNYPKSALNLIPISNNEIQDLIEKKIIKDDGKGSIIVEEWVKLLL